MEIKDVWIHKNTPKEEILKLAKACSCDACSKACEYSSGFLAEGDLDSLARLLNMTKQDTKDKFLEQAHIYNKNVFRPKLEREKGKHYGKCIFFEKGVGCKVHAAKPMHCKVSMNCKAYGEQLNTWFYLNHIIDKDDPEAIRQWAVYLETHPTIPGGTLQDLVPDKERLQGILSYKILRGANNDND